MIDSLSTFEQLKRIECPDATASQNQPIIFQGGRGSWVQDVEEREYLDLCAGFGALALGHHFEFHEGSVARTEFPLLQHGMGDLFPTVSKVKLLQKLLSLMPGYLEKGALMVTGGQCIEFALKTASLATNKGGFIAFHHGYHGLDQGVLSLCGFSKFRSPFGKLLTKGVVEHLPYGCSVDQLQGAWHRLEQNGIGCAGIVVEPVQGRGGVRFPPEGWLQSVSLWSREKGLKLILDEVFTGLGRIGTLSTSFSVSCDLACFGKILGGGMPLSACVGTAEIMDCWPDTQGEALHTGTFFGHPYSCRTGLDTLKIVSDPAFLENVRKQGNWVTDVLQDRIGRRSVIRDIRGQGLMVGIEFNGEGLGVEVFQRLVQDEGVMTVPSGPKGEVLSLSPALNISRQDLELGLTKIIKVVDAMPL